jgi:hypothetical protein
MRIFKYIVFISILSGIFFVIYRQSDKKGFRRWWTFFKTAIIFSAIAASLIPVNPEAIEPPGNNNQVYQERLLLDQEFNSFEDNDQKVILVKTGDSSPSVPISPGRGQPSPFPTAPSGGRPNRPVYLPKYRTAPKIVNPGLGAGANPAGAGGGGGAAEFNDQCPVPKEQQSEKSKTFDYDYRSNDAKKKKQSSEQSKVKDNLNDMPEFGPILEGSVIPVESLLGTSSGFKAQYKSLKKDSIAHKQGMSSIKKLAEGSLKIGDRNVRKIAGMKNIYEAKTKYARVYFQMKGDNVQIILPALKPDQKQSIKLLKKYFK